MKKRKIEVSIILSLILLVFANGIFGENSRSAKKDPVKRYSNKKDKKSDYGNVVKGKAKPKSKIKEKTVATSEKTSSSAAISKSFLLNKPISKFTESDKKKIIRELEILRRQKTTQQFLSIIQIAEAGEPNIMVGDKPGCRSRNLKNHPGEVLPKRCFYYFYDKKGRLFFSTASGNYQITRQNYRLLAPFLDITDFEVPSQQLLALELIRRGGRKPVQVRKGFEALVKGNVREAIKLSATDWASFPGSDLPGRKRNDVEKIIGKVLKDSSGGSKTVKKSSNTGKSPANKNGIAKTSFLSRKRKG